MTTQIQRKLVFFTKAGRAEEVEFSLPDHHGLTFVIDQLVMLHRPERRSDEGPYCVECTPDPITSLERQTVTWPCNTIKALQKCGITIYLTSRELWGGSDV